MLRYHLTCLTLLSAIGFAMFAWWSIPRRVDSTFGYFGWVVSLAFGTELVCYLAVLVEVKNVLLYNVFFGVEFFLMLAMVQAQAPRLRWPALLAAVVGGAAIVLSLARVDPRTVLMLEAILPMALSVSLLTVAALLDMAMREEVVLQRHPAFWLFMGTVVYFGGLLPVVGTSREIYQRYPDLYMFLWAIVPFLAVIRYILAGYACRLYARRALTDGDAW